MSKDLKAYLKNNKTAQKNSEENKTAREITDELSKKSSAELSSDFQSALATAKSNGTFNKNEILKMLHGIKGNMTNAEFEKIKSIVEKL